MVPFAASRQWWLCVFDQRPLMELKELGVEYITYVLRTQFVSVINGSISP